MSEKLLQKEAGIFKKIVRSYECKQYKNGLKFAKQILSNPKCAEHGETLAMKGLILNCMGRKEEAYEHVKKGLRNDLKSHVCWHVFGLLQRSDRKYDEAIKAYRNALKWDKDNLQILRDLSLLQLQMRNVDGFRETRFQLLKLRPTQRGSWVGYILGFHLVRDYHMALKTIAEYRKTQSPGKEKPDYEYSEMVLYEAKLWMEYERPDDALHHISEFREHICDELAVKELLAEIYLEKGNLKEAQKLYYELIKRNTEYRFYYQQLERCIGLDCDAKRLRLYRELQKKFPHSGLLKRLPMECATGDEFRDLVKVFLRNAFLKGVPSIFVRLKGHYADGEKGAIIGGIAEEFLQSLKACGKLCPDDSELADPSVELWVVHFLAQHCDQVGRTAEAVTLIDRALLHTPTLPELFMTKAKIFKHGGDDLTAAQMMEEAQSLDTADRFVTSKCCKYLMRVNRIERAVELVSLFTREGLPPLETLNDMQCNWFEIAMAKAYLRLGRVGYALKKCHQIDKHFSDIIDDQFDFHSYCMRKMTLRPYVRMLQMEDKLKGHPLYFDAAKLAMEIYLHLHDKPVAKQHENGRQEEESTVSKVEKKKMEKKQRKAQLKAQSKAMEEKKEQGKVNDVSRRVDLMAEKDDEFKPEQLEATDKPLEKALHFLKPLQLLALSRIETHLYAYRIHSKRGKFLLMLQAIRRAHAIDRDRPELHEHIVDFCCRVKQSREDLGDVVLAVIDQTLPDVKDGDKSLIEFNEDFIQKHRTSLPHVMIGCKVMVRLQPSQVDRAVKMMTDLDAIATGCSLQVCSDAFQLLKDDAFGDTSVALSEFRDKCHALFPLAVAFMPQSESPPQQQEANNSAEDKENVVPPLGASSH